MVAAHEANFALYERVLKQKRPDKGKVYSLHEPQASCIGKEKATRRMSTARRRQWRVPPIAASFVLVAMHDRR